MAPPKKGAAGDWMTRVRQTVDKKLGAGLTARFGEQLRSDVVNVIPTGIGVLDHVILGVGGFPCGQIVELFGDPDNGKTSLVLAAAGRAQALGYPVIYADAEQTLQTDRPRVFGVDAGGMLVIQPRSLEQTIDGLRAGMEALPDGGPALVVWDSLAAATPEVELGADAGESKMAVGARMIHRACKVLRNLAQQKGAALVFVNQVREKIGIVYGSPITTPGGSGPKFAAVVRIHLYGGKAVKEGDVAVGKDVTFKCVKSKFVPPGRAVQARFNFAAGWDDGWSTLNHAKDMKLVEDRARGEKAIAEARAKLGWKTQETA